MNSLRIMMLNLPSGPFPTDYPPVAISRVIEGLDPALNAKVSFINLDIERLSWEVLSSRIAAFDPHVIGISAILTTTYRTFKELSMQLRSKYPKIVQILGGEMGVVADLLLSYTEIDFIVIGEAEPTFSHLLAQLLNNGFNRNPELYASISGLCLRQGGLPFFTGYAKEDKIAGSRQINWELLEKHSDINQYIHPINGQYFRIRLAHSRMDDFLNLLYPENRDKNLTTMFASKGCVNHCTFCHRFFQGYRTLDVDEVLSHVDYLIKRFNIGLILFSEENFGQHREKTRHLVQELKKRRINWAATAVRVRSVNEDMIREWRASGCVHINFGIETLSEKMLCVMEKNATVEENLNALRWCQENQILVVIGFLIGMPGETHETIAENIRLVDRLIPENPRLPFQYYINYYQAVPGAPAYDYARLKGMIGRDKEEERYLLSLSGVNADNLSHYLNFTDEPIEEVYFWQYWLIAELIGAYIRKHGLFYTLSNKRSLAYWSMIPYAWCPAALREQVFRGVIIARRFGIRSLFVNHKLLIKTKHASVDRSLRKIVREHLPASLSSIETLRLGR